MKSVTESGLFDRPAGTGWIASLADMDSPIFNRDTKFYYHNTEPTLANISRLFLAVLASTHHASKFSQPDVTFKTTLEIALQSKT